VVEFHRPDDSKPGVSEASAPWPPFPVEYKRGKPKGDDSDKVQLCAQALCLEEMLDCTVPCGALFYGKTRRRTEVDFDDALRRETVHTARRLHALVGAGVTPRAVPEPKCQRCSLKDLCMPKLAQNRMPVDSYVAAAISEIVEA